MLELMIKPFMKTADLPYTWKDILEDKMVKIILMDILQGPSVISSGVQRCRFHLEDGQSQ
jgi:hypothetical protein